MNKQKFLKELESKLKILTDEERKDIINEYNDIINEKTKHGKTVDEAINEFGNIDDLVKEILLAYKINPDYNTSSKAGEKAKEVVETGEGLIKDCASKLSNFSKKTASSISNSNITVEQIFEIIIKSIILLVLFLIMRLPFMLLNGIGKGILDVALYPIDGVLCFIWTLLISIVYFAVCVLIAIATFKSYFNNNEKQKKENTKESIKDKKAEDKVEKSTKNEKKSDELKVNVQVAKDKSSPVADVVLTILKVFSIIFILIPAYFFIAALLVGMTFSVFYLIKGIDLVGIILIISGILFVNITFAGIIYRLLFSKKKIIVYPFAIGLVLIITGSFITADTAMEFKYNDSLANYSVKPSKSEYEEKIIGLTQVEIHNGEGTIIADNTLPIDTILIEVNYYKDINSIFEDSRMDENNKIISVGIMSYNPDQIKNMYHYIINDLKNKQIYDYEQLFDCKIKIKVNEKSFNKVTIID